MIRIPLRCEPTALPGVLLFKPDVFSDARGFFMETHHQEKYLAHGLDRVFVQDNLSQSCASTLRGLHYQLQRPQAKLVTVITGEVYDVALDIRRGSPTFGRWVAMVLSESNRQQLYIPEGFAHGFCVLSPSATFMYKCTDFYTPADEHGVRWSDPALGIPWPVRQPILSAKDQHYPCLQAVPEECLPVFSAPQGS